MFMRTYKKNTYMCKCVRELIWMEMDGTCPVKSVSSSCINCPLEEHQTLDDRGYGKF